MRFNPRDQYTRGAATAKARTLHPGAFAKYARDCPRSDRHQILLEVHHHDGQGNPILFEAKEPKPTRSLFYRFRPEVYLVAAGATWLEALERFFEWMEEQLGREDGETGSAGDEGGTEAAGPNPDGPGERPGEKWARRQYDCPPVPGGGA